MSVTRLGGCAAVVLATTCSAAWGQESFRRTIVIAGDDAATGIVEYRMVRRSVIVAAPPAPSSRPAGELRTGRPVVFVPTLEPRSALEPSLAFAFQDDREPPPRAKAPAVPRSSDVRSAERPRPAADAPPAKAGRTVSMLVTAYCPCAKCCGRATGVTASGKTVDFNGGCFVAADKSIPFGTMVSAPSYAGGRPVPVLDRGGAIVGNRLDVFFATHEQALKWGKRRLDVTIYD